MIVDVKVVGQQVMLLWHEEISPRAHHSDDVSLEGTIAYFVRIFGRQLNDPEQISSATPCEK
jgi:hypothetical protein